jgi:thioesterase domain-containing protein
MTSVPELTPVEALIPVWQRVLQRPVIGVDSNFFDLGGNPALAVQLVDEIATYCGRELSPLIIYQAPTISALAAVLDGSSSSLLQPLVLLKHGSTDPPVFVAHGLGGTVMELFDLVRHLPSPHPMFGLQARGTDGADRPFESIEDMGEFYADCIRRLQPHGPYYLIGYSLGGLVMLETAQRLCASGEDVGLLAMIDSYPHSGHLSLAARALLIMQRLRFRASISKRTRTAPFQMPVAPAFANNLERVRRSSYLALKRYRPRYYCGAVVFIRAATTTVFPREPRAVWGRTVGKLEVETVPGDHLGLIAEHAASLGAALSRHLARALNSERGRTP